MHKEKVDIFHVSTFILQLHTAGGYDYPNQDSRHGAKLIFQKQNMNFLEEIRRYNKAIKQNTRADQKEIIMTKFADHMEKIANGATRGYQKIEDGVVSGYKKIEGGVVSGYKKIEGGVVKGFTGIVDKMSGVMLNEDGSMKIGKVGETVVGAYKKVEDAFVNTFVAKKGEPVEDAKARVIADTEARQAKIKADAEAREASQKAMIQKNLEASRNAGKRN